MTNCLVLTLGCRDPYATSRSSISNLAWMRASLPGRVGGLGLRFALSSSAAAFIGSFNASRQHVNQVISDPSKSWSSGLDDAFFTLTLKFRGAL